jgi:hypothetical protein
VRRPHFADHARIGRARAERRIKRLVNHHKHLRNTDSQRESGLSITSAAPNTHTHTHIHTYIHTQPNEQTNRQTSTHKHKRTHAHTHMHTHLRLHGKQAIKEGARVGVALNQVSQVLHSGIGQTEQGALSMLIHNVPVATPIHTYTHTHTRVHRHTQREREGDTHTHTGTGTNTRKGTGIRRETSHIYTVSVRLGWCSVCPFVRLCIIASPRVPVCSCVCVRAVQSVCILLALLGAGRSHVSATVSFDRQPKVEVVRTLMLGHKLEQVRHGGAIVKQVRQRHTRQGRLLYRRRGREREREKGGCIYTRTHTEREMGGRRGHRGQRSAHTCPCQPSPRVERCTHTCIQTHVHT